MPWEVPVTMTVLLLAIPTLRCFGQGRQFAHRDRARVSRHFRCESGMTRPRLPAVAQQRGKVRAEESRRIGELAAGRSWMKVTEAACLAPASWWASATATTRETSSHSASVAERKAV